VTLGSYWPRLNAIATAMLAAGAILTTIYQAPPAGLHPGGGGKLPRSAFQIPTRFMSDWHIENRVTTSILVAVSSL
jgi:hypothetical protein